MYCENCKKVIGNNFELHLIHCARFLTLCPKCDEAIPKSDFDKHQKSCVAESGSMPETPPIVVENEEPVASASIREIAEVSCRYCDLGLPEDVIEDHEDYCGCRTERCEGCGKRVILKYSDFHISSNCTLMRPDEQIRSPPVTNADRSSPPEIVREPFHRRPIFVVIFLLIATFILMYFFGSESSIELDDPLFLSLKLFL